MELKKYSFLSHIQQKEIEQFINNNSFNKGISFLENDMNFYEDFPCFYMLYEQNYLISFLSVFIPDSASCEIYFHISDNQQTSCSEIFQYIYTDLESLLDKYQLFNKYIIFENNTTNINSLQSCFNLSFSHSECLMQYDNSYTWTNMCTCLDYEFNEDDAVISLNTFLEDDYVGSCQIEISGDYALIHDVEVKKKYRGLGYGSETLYHTINHLTNNNYKKILLHVNSANTIAFTMYSHHGFIINQQLDYWKI